MHVQHQIRTVHFARMPTQVRFHNVKAVLDWRSFWCVRGPRRHAVPGVEQQRTNDLQPEGNAKPRMSIRAGAHATHRGFVVRSVVPTKHVRHRANDR